MRILGVDPGSARIGFGLIIDRPRLKMVDYGTLEVRGLKELAVKYERLLNDLKPGLVAIEKLYFAKNSKTALSVAEARGVLQLLTFNCRLPVLEYSPATVKKTVCGYGRADKKAVAKMVCWLLGVDKIQGFDDASDALALALTAALSYPHLTE